MMFGKKIFSSMLRAAAMAWQENTGALSEIDSRFGDGDHGVTIGKISALMLERIDGWKDESIKEFIEDIASGVLGISGGSAGPLYGTLIEGLASPLGDEDEIDGAKLKAMLAGSRDALFEITKARQGDKTMMDSLIPAVDAAQGAGDDIGLILAAAAAAAVDGAKKTEGMVSKFGRARSYGDRTLGTQDAGAVSTSLFFEGLAKGWEKGKAHKRND
jgi:dihydroxyacetone kinase-like protein